MQPLAYAQIAQLATGGPGGSGFTAILGYGQGLGQLFQGAYDIVTWDPRGVGHTL